MLGSAPPPASARAGVNATCEGGVLAPPPPPPDGLAAIAFPRIVSAMRRARALTSATRARRRAWGRLDTSRYVGTERGSSTRRDTFPHFPRPPRRRTATRAGQPTPGRGRRRR